VKDDEDYLWPHIVLIAGDGAEGSNVNDRRISCMLQGLYGLPATIHVLLLRTANLESQDIIQSELSLILTENTRGMMERASIGGTIPDVLGRIAARVAGSVRAQAHQYGRHALRYSAIRSPRARIGCIDHSSTRLE
jgi:hypothetical protein